MANAAARLLRLAPANVLRRRRFPFALCLSQNHNRGAIELCADTAKIDYTAIKGCMAGAPCSLLAWDFVQKAHPHRWRSAVQATWGQSLCMSPPTRRRACTPRTRMSPGWWLKGWPLAPRTRSCVSSFA